MTSVRKASLRLGSSPALSAAMKARYNEWEKTMLPYPDDNYSHTLKGDKYAEHYQSLGQQNN